MNKEASSARSAILLDSTERSSPKVESWSYLLSASSSIAYRRKMDF